MSSPNTAVKATRSSKSTCVKRHKSHEQMVKKAVAIAFFDSKLSTFITGDTTQCQSILKSNHWISQENKKRYEEICNQSEQDPSLYDETARQILLHEYLSLTFNNQTTANSLLSGILGHRYEL